MKTAKRSISSLLFITLLFANFAIAASPTMPNFFARRDYTGLFPSWVGAADTNGDGIPDLITEFAAHINVQFGNGDGTFGVQVVSSQTVMSGIDTFVTADLNGDGKVDAILAGSTNLGGGYPSGITICLGNGDGTFQAGTFYQVADSQPGGLGFLTLGDFNGDGSIDVVAPDSNGVWLWTGKGDGSFNAGVLVASLASDGGSVATADFNSDGKLDLVVTLPYNLAGFAVLLGNGNGTFQPAVMFPETGRGNGLAVGPLTKGGPPGIVASSGTNFYLYYGDGAGHFSGPHLIPSPGTGYIVLGDLEGDGIPDIVCACGYVSYGTANGTFSPPVYYPVENSNVGRTWNVVLADLTHSGRLDILTDNYTANSVLLNLGNHKFEDGIWYGVSGGAGCGAIADFNRDGKPDLAVNGLSSITILLGTGSATKPFTTGTTISVPHPGCPLAGDLNGDGIPDLLDDRSLNI